MRFNQKFVLPLLVASVAAGPADLFKRAACNADNCLRAIPTTSNTKQISDCSSFFLKTVTACAPTVTSTTTVTTTAPAVTVSTDVSTTDLQTSIDSETTTLTATTIFDTLTITTPTTTTISSTTTLTTTVTAGAKQKRDVPASLIASLDLTPDVQSFIDGNVAAKRAVTACPNTVIPSTVPTYASACSGTSRYSSACSCRGITETFTTITPAASTTVSTITSTVTPTVTATNTIHMTQTVVVTQFATVTTTFETTATTQFVPTVVTTETTLATSVSTVTVPAPVCSSFILQATSGTFNGQYMIQSPNSWDLFGFTTDRSVAASNSYSIDQSTGHLIRADGSAIEAYVGGGQNHEDWLRAYPVIYGTGGPGGDYPMGTARIAGSSLNSGAITISRSDGCSVLSTCNWLRYSDAPVIGCGIIRSDCVAFNLVAVPAC